MIEEYIWPTLKEQTLLMRGRYLLGYFFCKTFDCKRLVEIAKKKVQTQFATVAQEKGNDQVRFELSIRAFDPDIKIIAPWREWDNNPEKKKSTMQRSHNIPFEITRETNYSKDKTYGTYLMKDWIWKTLQTDQK